MGYIERNQQPTLGSAFPWKQIDEVVSDTLSLNLFQQKYSKQAIEFLNWYEENQRLRQVSLRSPVVKDWIVRGIRKMNTIISILNTEIGKVNREIQRLEGTTGESEIKTRTLERYKQYSELLSRYKQSLLGCRGNMGDWFVNVLGGFKTLYPKDEVFDRFYWYFRDQCTQTRLELLKF
jgi:hypothetical protein